MTVSNKKVDAGKIIKKTTGTISSETVVGASNSFNERVIDAIYAYARYSSSNVPYFSGSATWGKSGNSGAYAYNIQNPQAIETSQFDSPTPSKLSISDTYITADTLWSSIKSLTILLSKIRPFRAYWYHNNDGSRYEVTHISGRAVFKETLPNVTGGSDVACTETRFWTRSGSVTPQSKPNPVQTINEPNVVKASEMNDDITECYNEWMDKCYNNNELVYNLYTCHYACYGDCYGARSRR